MSIEIRQPGEAKAAAKAGAMIGDARRRAIEWEMEKAEIRSRQAFEQELRDQQYKYDAVNRARDWQIEKMEIASRMDFEQQERQRLRTKAEYTAARDTLDKNKDNMGDGEYERALFRLDSIYAPKGVSEAVTGLGLQTRQQNTGLFNLGGTDTLTDTGTNKDNPLGLNISGGTAAPKVSPLPERILSMEKTSQFRVISPNGKEEIIASDKWPEYKAKGYILAEIKKQRQAAQNVRETEETISSLPGAGVVL